MKKASNRLLVIILVLMTAGSALGLSVYHLWLKDRYIVPILMYHRVGDYPEKDLNTVSVKAFESHMAFLKEHRYNVIAFDQLVQGIKTGRQFPRNTVVIQFDDGFKDNYTNAYPILKRYGFPAMVFLISDVIGNDDRFITWEQMKEMESSNFLAGAHTRTHPYLPDTTLARAEDEIAGSKRVIEEKLGHKIDYFVYPAGGFRNEDKEFVKKAGYKAASSTNRGFDRYNRDLHELKRIRMNEKDGEFILWAKFSGYYNLFRKLKSGA
jgi:peptidoglycan/xylan/chitin deacetylase (PgdA/CDA1 family)